MNPGRNNTTVIHDTASRVLRTAHDLAEIIPAEK